MTLFPKMKQYHFKSQRGMDPLFSLFTIQNIPGIQKSKRLKYSLPGNIDVYLLLLSYLCTHASCDWWLILNVLSLSPDLKLKLKFALLAHACQSLQRTSTSYSIKDIITLWPVGPGIVLSLSPSPSLKLKSKLALLARLWVYALPKLTKNITIIQY